MKLTFVAVGLLMATGCSSMFTGRADTIRVRVVDAGTGDPIPGVSIVWREDLDDLLAGHLQTGPATLAPSNGDGIIIIPNVRSKMTGRFILQHPVYNTVYGVCADGELNVSDEIQPAPMPQDTFTLDDPQNILQKNGSFLIRMQK